MPVNDDARQGRVHLPPRGATSPRRRRRSARSREKNIELQGLLERIRELDEIKTQFFANVSHELRTPLALILGPAQRLIDDAGTMSVTQRRESGQVVARNARMLLKHVNDLLDMSKIEARKLKIELQRHRRRRAGPLPRLALCRARRRSADRVRRRRRRPLRGGDRSRQAAARGDEPARQRLQVRAGRRPDPLLAPPVGGGDRHRGGRLRTRREAGAPAGDFRALPAGRRRHQPDGRRAPASAWRSRRSSSRCTRDASTCSTPTLAEPGSRSALPLKRVDARESPSPIAAAGLDRSVLDGVLEELRFAGIKPKAAVPVPGPVTAGRPRVLVVEDNPDMNRFVAECLSRDYDVATAFDGRDGLEQALRFNPMVVVSDIMMPHVSGVEMVAQMRARPRAAADADPAALGQGGRRADGAAARPGRAGLHRQAVLRAGPAGSRPQPGPRRAGARSHGAAEAPVALRVHAGADF